MPAGLFITIAILVMMTLCRIDGDSDACVDGEFSPLCLCRSTFSRRSSPLIDTFLAKLVLSQCDMPFSPIRQCHYGRFNPSSISLTQLVPNLVNISHCLQSTHCIHSLRHSQECDQCEIVSSIFLTEDKNQSFSISTTTQLPSDACFHVCEHDKSCGFLCFDRRMAISINCSGCQGGGGRRRRRNVICSCVKVRQRKPCSHSLYETTTQRWMQKQGFPAAGILALLVVAGILLIVAVKLINHKLDIEARRQNESYRRSVATITTYRSRQPSPTTAVTVGNTPLILPVDFSHREKAKLTTTTTTTTNSMVALLNDSSQRFVVDIHRRCDEDELSVFLLEKTPAKRMSASMNMPDNDDDDEEDEEEEEENQT